MIFEAIVSWVKGLFGPKGATQIGSGNKAITAGDHAGVIFAGDHNVVHYSKPEAPERVPVVPTVDASLAVATHPIRGYVDLLSIRFHNTTDRSIFIGNVLLEMNDDHNIFCPRDSLTEEIQQKREVRAGDTYSFNIDSETLRSIKRPATDFICAVVADAVGKPYKSDSKGFSDKVNSLINMQR